MLAISDITQHINALHELLDAGSANEHHPLAVLVAMLVRFGVPAAVFLG
jgi:hypothetical protein